MTEFVLEILDGDRVGEIFELSADPLTFGRRGGSTVVLNDEKCSGRHATVVEEDGQWVLRDLDSTNGTLLDGRRVDEVGLSANDIFQVGVTRIAFKAKGAPTPSSDLSVKKVDSATLAKSRRGGGIGMLLVLVVVLGGAAGWWFFLRGGENAVGPVGRTVKAPLTVTGNQLAGGDFEDEEGVVFERVAGIGFEPDFGAVGANSGTRYLLAARGEDATASYALSRSAAIQVSSGGGAKLRAFVMTTGAATTAIRARFTSSSEAQPQLLFTGTAPKQYAEFTEVVLELAVPEGCDRVAVELLGFLPGADATVSVDDVSMVSDGAGGRGNKIQTSVGQRVTWTGSAIQIDDGQNSALLGVRPVTNDPTLSILASAGLLCLSDLGIVLTVADDAGAILMKTTGGSGEALVLRFEPGIAASGVLVRQGETPFTNQGQTFQGKSVDCLLFGYKRERFMIRLPQPAAVSAAVVGRAFEVTLPDPSEFRLVYDFQKERTTARGILRDAERLFGESQFKAVLTALGRLLDSVPHDDAVASQASVLRTKVRNQLGDAIRHLESELDEAVYFGSLRGYRRIQGQLSNLVESYGREQLLQPEKVAAMEQKVAANVARIEAEMGAEMRRKLEVLARIYGKVDKGLGDLITNYTTTYLPKAGDPPPGAKPAAKPAGAPATKTPDKENE